MSDQGVVEDNASITSKDNWEVNTTADLARLRNEGKILTP